MVPGNLNRRFHTVFTSYRKKNTGGALPTPGALDANKRLRLVVGEFMLMFGRKLHHGVFLVRVAERGEYFAVHPEVRMIHVRLFLGSREAEGDPSKLAGSHGPSTIQRLTAAVA